MRTLQPISMLLLVAALAAASPAGADWPENGVPVAATPEYQAYPVACSDGAGGVITAWQDKRNSVYEDIHAQRLDAHGRPLWGPDGIVVCDAASIQNIPRIAADGQGGAVLVWWDQREGVGSVLYAQRLGADGGAVWTAGGVRVFGYDWSVDSYAIAGDGLGGALIAWHDNHGDYTNHRIYVQRLAAADGGRLWGTDGMEACTTVSDQQYASVVATGDGGALLVWSDARNATDWDVYAQWIRAGGGRVWSTGVGMSTATGSQWMPEACSDGRGGIVAAWQDTRNGGWYDVYAAGFDTNMTYTMYDLPICTAAEEQSQIRLAPDGQGGAYFAWYDARGGYTSDIYAQHVSRGSIVEWMTDGIPVCDAAGYQSAPVMTADGYGGAVLAWSDSRRGSGGSDLYAQRLDPDGIGDWTDDGVLLCESPGDATVGAGGIAGDGMMGGIVVWHDSRAPNWDVYAQRVERSGHWGYPAAEIAGVADVPFDQGGRVTVTWDASRLDVFPVTTVTHYSVWRSLGETGLAELLEGGARGVRLADVGDDFEGPAYLLGEGKDAGAYEWLANLPAHWLAEYAYTAATLNDSMPGNPAWHHFFVAAHTAEPFVFWDSLPDSGYSVDNLAPAAPLGLAGNASYDPLGLRVSWRPNDEDDLAGYRVYRGTDPDFVPAAGNLLAAVADTSATDGGWDPYTGYHYKVTAVDAHGNESPWAYLDPGTVSAGDGPPVAPRPFLASHPNPFNPLTRIVYALDRAAPVTLRILDARGREVAVLPQGMQAAGRHEVLWNGRDGRDRALPSGVYLCRLEAGALRLRHKMMLVR